MGHLKRCRRLIPAFLLASILSLFLPIAAAAEAGAPRGPAERGRIALVLDSLWRWLGLAGGEPTSTSAPDTGTPGPPPTGGESQGGQDPNGSGAPPPEYEPDLNPGSG